MSRYRLSADATDDLRDIAEYIGVEAPMAALRFTRKIRTECQRIADSPGIGHSREDLAEANILFWPVGRYLIAYRVALDRVEIARIVHGARDLAVLLGD